MAPVYSTLSTTGKAWIASGWPNTTVSWWLQDKAAAWIAAIGDTGVIWMDGFNKATTWSGNPAGLFFHVGDALAGGNSGMGVFFYRTSNTATTQYYNPVYGHTPSTSNNGYGSFTSISYSGTSWATGDGYEWQVAYCADPGDQYFVFTDSQYKEAFGLARLNRPTGVTYPSGSIVSEWVVIGGSSGQYAPICAGGTATAGWGGPQRSPFTPNDNWYMFRDLACYTNSLYIGNLPPGIARVGGSAAVWGGTINNGGTETYQCFKSANTFVRTAI